MKKLQLFLAIIGLLFIQACSNEKKGNENASSIVTDESINSPENIISDSNNKSAINPLSETNTEQTIAPNVQVTNTQGINPAHGQPGHRCDIAVGAPLNSPPGQNNTTSPSIINAAPEIPSPSNNVSPANSNGQIQTIQATPSSVPTPPGMNPPHGQPGHNCTIAVGAPLKK